MGSEPLDLDRIKGMLEAYPEDVFVPLSEKDWRRADRVLLRAGISMTAMSAEYFRFCLNLAQVAELVAEVERLRGP